MYRVQISARIINWPRICACCCGSSDTYIQVTSSRVKGVRVVRTQTSSWDVPYCGNCVRHVDLGERLREFSVSVFHEAWICGGVIAVMAVVMVLALVVGWTMFGIMALVLTLVTVLLMAGLFPTLQRRHDDEVGRLEAERQRLRDKLDATTAPHCVSIRHFAAGYEGWHGSVHTFVFANADFANAFVAANPGKCLG